MVCVSLVTPSVMVCARVASLASWSQLWALQLSRWPSEAAVSPFLVFSLPMLVSDSMVLEEEEVSQITNVLSYLCIQLLLCRSIYVQFNLGLGQLSKSHFKSIKNKLSSYISKMLWQMVSKEV